MSIFMLIFLRFNNYIKFFKQSLKIVRNMRTRGNFMHLALVACAKATLTTLHSLRLHCTVTRFYYLNGYP